MADDNKISALTAATAGQDADLLALVAGAITKKITVKDLVRVRKAQFVLVEDQKSATVAGGDFTLGAWQTRTLNTEVADTGALATLASNKINLATGDYFFVCSAPAYRVGEHQVKLFNVTDNADVKLGDVEFTNSGNDNASTRSYVWGFLTLAAAKDLEIRHRCAATRLADGFGKASPWDAGVFARALFLQLHA